MSRFIIGTLAGTTRKIAIDLDTIMMFLEVNNTGINGADKATEIVLNDGHMRWVAESFDDIMSTIGHISKR